MTNQNIDAYYSICLNDKCTQMFNDTILGIDYWRKHKNQKCYKCGEKGHVSAQCDQICKLCKNYHPSLKICIFKTYQMLEKIYDVLNRKSTNLIEKYNKIVKEEELMKRKIIEEKFEILNKKKNEINSKSRYDINLLKINNIDNIKINESKYIFINNFNEYKLNDINYINYKNNKYNINILSNLLNYVNIFNKDKIIKYKSLGIESPSRIVYMSEKYYYYEPAGKYMEKIKTNINIGEVKEYHMQWSDEEFNKISKNNEGKEEKKEEKEEKKSEVIIRNNGFNIYAKTEKEKEEIKKKEEELRRMKKENEEKKKNIKEKVAFYNDKCYQKIKKIGDLNKMINNRYKKDKNMKERIDDLYDKFEKKKQSYQELKEKEHNLYNRCNAIINAARRKGERIKRQAYKRYKYYFGKKRGMTDSDIEDEIEECDDIIEKHYGENNRKYDEDYFDLMEDDKIGEYDDDPHILDYDGYADF